RTQAPNEYSSLMDCSKPECDTQRRFVRVHYVRAIEYSVWAVACHLRLDRISAHTSSGAGIYDSRGRSADRLIEGISSFVVAVETFTALALAENLFGMHMGMKSSAVRGITAQCWRGVSTPRCGRGFGGPHVGVLAPQHEQRVVKHQIQNFAL